MACGGTVHMSSAHPPPRPISCSSVNALLLSWSLSQVLLSWFLSQALPIDKQPAYSKRSPKTTPAKLAGHARSISLPPLPPHPAAALLPPPSSNINIPAPLLSSRLPGLAQCVSSRFSIACATCRLALLWRCLAWTLTPPAAAQVHSHAPLLSL